MKISQYSLIPFFVLLTTLFLAGCKTHHSYNYLMTHPAALQREVARCLAVPNTAIDPDCVIVSNAQNDFETEVASERADPQGYGKKILAAQWQLVTLANDIAALRSKSNLDLVKLKLVKRAYHEQAAKVKIMWNVIAVTNWE
ncbi:MAG: EexN family lipoprotein [Gammaproteobacteria bacterium]|nr:EexN family lipoprotein [Gammaproteobacteria bacterium]